MPTTATIASRELTLSAKEVGTDRVTGRDEASEVRKQSLTNPGAFADESTFHTYRSVSRSRCVVGNRRRRIEGVETPRDLGPGQALPGRLYHECWTPCLPMRDSQASQPTLR